MPIKVKMGFTDAVSRYVDEAAQRKIEKAVFLLGYVGEKVVSHARNLPSLNRASLPVPIPPHQPNYIDDTGNLRSSIGYVIVVDGTVVRQDFKGNAMAGISLAHHLASSYQTGICLIVVAGMKYASYVSAKGYDVLDSAEIIAEKLARQLFSGTGEISNG